MFGAAHRGCQTETEKSLQYKIAETGILNRSGEKAGNFFHQELLLPIDFGGHIHVRELIMDGVLVSRDLFLDIICSEQNAFAFFAGNSPEFLWQTFPSYRPQSDPALYGLFLHNQIFYQLSSS